MRIEHVNLVVRNIEEVTNFLGIAFPHWKIRGQDKSEWYGKPRTWLHFGEDDFYIALSDNGEGPNRDLMKHTPGLAHTGLVIDDIGGLIARYRANGIEPSQDLTTFPARKNVYYIDPAGFEWEFIQYLSDIPTERHHYEA